MPRDAMKSRPPHLRRKARQERAAARETTWAALTHDEREALAAERKAAYDKGAS